TLVAHNRWRDKYNMPPLKYDKRLESNALAWACHMAAGGVQTYGHSADKSRVAAGWAGLWPLGENCYFLFGSALIAWAPSHSFPVDEYGKEAEDYATVNKKPKGTGEYRHFTQLIWRATKLVACGYAAVKDPDGRTRGVWVHRYFPRGNSGQNRENT